MKKINLKRAIQLPNAQKTILRPGVHNIQEDIFAHWFIQGLVAKGDITVMDETVKPNVLLSTNKSAVAPIPVLPKISSPPPVVGVEVEEILPKTEVVESVAEVTEEKVEEQVIEKPVEEVKTTKIVRKRKKV